MTRSWISVALFAGAWAFGYPLYHEPCRGMFWLLAVSGVVMQWGCRCGVPRGIAAGMGAALLAPCVVWLAWPFNTIAILVGAGLFIRAVPLGAGASRARDRVACALVGSGGIFGAQGLSLAACTHLTAVARELPAPLAPVFAAIADLTGARAGACGKGISFFSMRQVHVMGATWDLVLDPVLLCFAAGGIALLALRGLDREAGGISWRRAAVDAGIFAASIVLWIPLRFCLLQGLFLHRALLVEYDDPLALMSQYWSPWVFLALLVPPLVFSSWRLRRPCLEFDSGARPAKDGSKAARWVLASAALSAALLCAGLFWDPPGGRKPGRVAVDEYHSDWERTDRPFDTTWYGQDSTYNYAAIFDYTGRHFDTEQIVEPLTPAVLSNVDVLILKIPTRKYEPGEIEAVVRFVEEGGGLFLVGEHTDVFRSGTFLNEIARRLGVEFRSDSLLHIDKVFEQTFVPPRVPHPIVQHVPALRFQVSCSLAARGGKGRPVIVSRGMRALNADFSMSNYYPEVKDYSDARYGAFVQMWAGRQGRGRVAAFTDSTLFSNFSAFEPGVSELWLGTLEWLNRRNAGGDPRPVLWALAAAAGAAGVFLAATRGHPGWVLAAAAAMFGWSVAGLAVRAAHAAAMPLPKPVRPFVRVNVDRNISRVPLTEGGFLGNHESSFGIFEMWVLRLGYFTRRCFGVDAFDGDLLLVMYPEGRVPGDYARRLAEYVRGGGRLLVLDSERHGASAANELLEPFGLSIDRSTVLDGVVEPAEGAKAPCGAVRGRGLCVSGGRALLSIEGRPVGACAAFGKGTVVALGCGGIFDDDVMGGYFYAMPEGDLADRYALEFSLLRGIITDALFAFASGPGSDRQ